MRTDESGGDLISFELQWLGLSENTMNFTERHHQWLGLSKNITNITERHHHT